MTGQTRVRYRFLLRTRPVDATVEHCQRGHRPVPPTGTSGMANPTLDLDEHRGTHHPLGALECRSSLSTASNYSHGCVRNEVVAGEAVGPWMRGTDRGWMDGELLRQSRKGIVMINHKLATLGLSTAFVLALHAPVAASGQWEEIAIEPGDSTTCEFEPGVITEYEVDVSTLPQFDRQKVTQVDLPSGDQQTILRFRRPDVQFLKLDPLAPGPDVLVERQTANLRIVTSAAGETLDINGHITIVERTPDGHLVDRNRQTLRGADADGPIIVSETGVCRP